MLNPTPTTMDLVPHDFEKAKHCIRIMKIRILI